MRMLLIAASLLVSCLSGQSPELTGVRDATDKLVSRLRLDGAGLAVVRAKDELHRGLHGNVGAQTVMPIASASKWLTVAAVLTLVDEGKLELDQPVARYVEEFDRDDKRRVTLRQCLANTSGLPARLRRVRGLDMDRFAELAADTALRSQPRSAFRYGGVGFQMAAIAAERVADKSWHQLFEERIAEPLGMKDTRFGSMQPIGGEPGLASLPWAGGGAVSTLDDYAKFVRMLLGNGVFEGTRVLSAASVDEMMRDQVPPRVDVRAPSLSDADLRYGLGTWIVALDDGRVRQMDPGAFGFTPWLDRDAGIGGVFAVQDRVTRVLRQLPELQEAVRAAATSAAVVGYADTVELDHGGRRRRYHLHVPAHEQNIAGMPLLLVLHGGGGNGAHVRDVTGLDELGVDAGFVVAFPDGTGRLPRKLLTWNSGGIDVYASRHRIDDVAFLRRVVTDIQQRVPIDSRRIYACGHSNGGMMCHRLAREAADVFAGIAVVGGAMNFTDVDAQDPIAVLMVHGTDDEHVAIGGGATSKGRSGRVDASLQQAVDYYVARNGLPVEPQVAVDGDVRVARHRAADEDGKVQPVWTVTLQGGGHAWPGSESSPRLLAAPHPWQASKGILEFFGGAR